ncbi:histidinol-phosphate transaminase [Aneurinibacillus aneurinilyticus]|jgi:histidinol-phosphate aminotransferase|uniref:Histidinol-phosphate aminotransferase n=2 Tax=Aneurinibacillus aneurinilyticus TaxID=1391 RepID=A0A848D218_ANEAE|nr:histidinol-phosphate transaminase [Aneurinibacillus aneurinilyticus]ERI06738.1 histidinol-phosphate transaminase [Aneurinibacillus aneurinilyticus ATCC 12856]MED0704971.1 histidinol-phosphate transaminase [Aneurinibacillus aneurinilyticus]MED0721574.1 histidinol-phosphate transaminase [Aneurinibacillus aneurinilyticus]MED0733709.1 histidinol-phosphate transaminase [Aneurinibacillus aneurinilyticus]MED0741260.1 histidinol-phosphate transaminase [Aneurinibacillus aneurinilyticus]
MSIAGHQKIIARKQLENVGVYKPGKPVEEVKRELGLSRIIKLASNENPLGYSPHAREAMLREMGAITFYPEGTAPMLAHRLAEKLQVAPDQIIVGNGSDEILHLLTRSYIREGDEAVMAAITFPRYETNVKIEGGVPRIVPLIDGVHDLNGMLAAINEKTRMIFVCNPNNPTGTIVGKAELQSFIQQVPDHILLIIDEAYFEYVTDDDYLDCASIIASYPNVIVLRTFSKIYGLAALRIGYGIMHPAFVQELIKVKEPFNTNRMAQAAALASLDDENFVQECRAQNDEGRRYIEQETAKLGLDCFPSQGNFVMIKLSCSGEEVFQALLHKGIIVRPGEALGLARTIRVSVGTAEENELFIQALREVMS